MKYDLSKPLDKNKALTYFSKLLESDKEIEIKELKAIRTIKQNKYLHKLFEIFAIELGYRKHEAKTLLKRECTWMKYQKNNQWFLRSTADLDTKEMSDFIDFIRTYSAQNGVYLLTADEYIQNRFEIDSYIDKHKEFL